jgi:hypothetical protein
MSILVLLLALNTELPGQTSNRQAQQPKQRVIKCGFDSTVNAAGDVDGNIAFVFDADLYQAIKENYPAPELFCREFANKRQKWDVSDLHAAYDDQHRAVLLKMTMKGLFRNRGTHWESEELDEGTTLVEKGNNYVKLKSQEEIAANVYLVVYQTLKFKDGVSNIEWEPDVRVLSFKMPAPALNGQNTRLKKKVLYKKRIMSATYKLFGNPEFVDLWVAKAIFKNAGDSLIKDLKVRFKLSNYTGGWSEYKINEVVVPGQTVVETYYPILDRSVAELTAGTPLKLTMEYSYTDASGQPKQYTDTKRIIMLGINELVFGDRDESELSHWKNNTKSPALWKDLFNNGVYTASWVCSSDPLVIEFAGMANEMAAGAGAAIDDRSALLVAKAIYELMLYNKVTYQSPPALFDRALVQHVKYPRDVIRNKSGTCIDLAISFASIAEAVGMDPFLILIPGHCFPGFILPRSKQPVAVEMTMLGGGTRQSSQPFEAAVQKGNQELQQAVKDGRYIEISIKELRKKGMLNPELEKLPANILAQYGIKKPAGQVQVNRGTQQQPQQPMPQPGQQGNLYRHPNGLFAIPAPANFTVQQPDNTTTYFVDNNRNAMVMVVAFPRNQYSLDQVLGRMFQTFQGAMGANAINAAQQPKPVTFCGRSAYLDVLSASLNSGNAAGFYVYTQSENYYYIFACSAMQQVFSNYEKTFVAMCEGMQAR